MPNHGQLSQFFDPIADWCFKLEGTDEEIYQGCDRKSAPIKKTTKNSIGRLSLQYVKQIGARSNVNVSVNINCSTRFATLQLYVAKQLLSSATWWLCRHHYRFYCATVLNPCRLAHSV
jgi:hypothetical protein